MNEVPAANTRVGSGVLALFTITVFTSAVLLFAVQPMFAKMVLPLLGGTPAVWNMCMVFFQATLLAGYAYAHASARTVGIRWQVAIHLVLLATPLLLLPIAVPATWTSPAPHHPELWLLALLIVTLGLPLFVVSTTGPLVQAWFARTNHPLASDPYFLYAASNTGSLAALLAYPTLIEPTLRLADQSHLWTIGYVIVALLVVGCAVIARYPRVSASQQVGLDQMDDVASRAMPEPDASISVWKRGRWVLLAFIPSSLMLGLTTYLTTDVAPMPLLWVIPLAIYLFSFVLTFGRRIHVSYSVVSRLMPILIVPLAATMAVASVGGALILVPLHLVTLFGASLLCHGELAHDRPPPRHLTEFYLWIGVGGVLGGTFNALVAPAIFNTVVEYPLALVMVCLVRRLDISAPTPSRSQDLRRAIMVVPAILGLLWLAYKLPLLSSLPAVLAVGLPALLCFALRERPLPFGLAVGTLVVAAPIISTVDDGTVYRERSFFGVSQVRAYPTERLTLLLSGTTKHGAQSLDPARRQEPLSYYHRTGPIGQVFAAIRAEDASPVAIIGLGAGSLACYGTPGQQFTFYEIDPTVARIARDPRYFTFLQLCPPDIRVVLGDARLSLAAAPDASHGLIVLDAFSSDAIPSHLLTREAVELYLTKLRASGLLAFHISNNRLDLEPIVANLAHSAQLVVLGQFDERVSPEETRAGKVPSHWVLAARRREDLRTLPLDQRWRILSAHPDKALWTDDFSNIFGAIKWR